jgi:hypothetical protein
MTKTSRRLTLVQIVFGVWLIITPYIFDDQLPSLLNSLILGTLIGAFSIYDLMFLETTHKEINVKISSLILFLGIWLMISSILFAPQIPVIYNNLIVGIAIVATSSYNRFIGKKVRARTDNNYPHPT